MGSRTRIGRDLSCWPSCVPDSALVFASVDDIGEPRVLPLVSDQDGSDSGFVCGAATLLATSGGIRATPGSCGGVVDPVTADLDSDFVVGLRN